MFCGVCFLTFTWGLSLIQAFNRDTMLEMAIPHTLFLRSQPGHKDFR